MGKISTLLDVDIWIYVWIWINRDIFKTNANVLYWYEVFHSKGEEKRKKKKKTLIEFKRNVLCWISGYMLKLSKIWF